MLYMCTLTDYSNLTLTSMYVVILCNPNEKSIHFEMSCCRFIFWLLWGVLSKINIEATWGQWYHARKYSLRYCLKWASWKLSENVPILAWTGWPRGTILTTLPSLTPLLWQVNVTENIHYLSLGHDYNSIRRVWSIFQQAWQMATRERKTIFWR